MILNPPLPEEILRKIFDQLPLLVRRSIRKYENDRAWSDPEFNAKMARLCLTKLNANGPIEDILIACHNWKNRRFRTISLDGSIPLGIRISEQPLLHTLSLTCSALGADSIILPTGARLPHLSKLSLKGGICRSPVTIIGYLRAAPHLKSLKLSDNQLGSDNWRAIAAELSLCPELTKLCIGGNLLTDADVRAIPPSIRKLNLKKNKILRSAPLNPELVSLSLSNNRIQNRLAISTFTNLQKLKLKKCEITSIEGLSQLTELKVLDLSLNEFQGIAEITTLTKLSRLALRCCHLGSEPNSLQSLTRLTSLDLSLTNYNELFFIKTFTNLTRLSVSKNCDIDIPLECFPRLEFLDAACNVLEIETVRMLAQKVSTHLSLAILNLDRTLVPNEELPNILKDFFACRTLQQLHLGENPNGWTSRCYLRNWCSAEETPGI